MRKSQLQASVNTGGGLAAIWGGGEGGGVS
jgi:hypothetical protein